MILFSKINTPDKNRTCIYPLGGGYSVHLTTGALKTKDTDLYQKFNHKIYINKKIYEINRRLLFDR